MLQFLVLLLDDTSISYCHATNPFLEKRLMPLDTLKMAIRYGMKENLMIQYVMPDYTLPNEYFPVLESIDNIKIGIDVLVFNRIPILEKPYDTIVLRISFQEFIENIELVIKMIPFSKRISIIFTNIEAFSDQQITAYAESLDRLIPYYVALFERDGLFSTQLNLLTDRVFATEMHNCGAGISSVTIAPNGKFYLCPAYYYDESLGIDNKLNFHNPSSSFSIGDLFEGLSIHNKHLFDLQHSPLCRQCDAYHCNRCIWLNQRLTYEVNTPSHQQCVMSHIERNASLKLSGILRERGFNTPVIPYIAYLDPFDSINRY